MENSNFINNLIKKEKQKCKDDLQYFLDEYGRIPSSIGNVKFFSRQIQRDIAKALCNNTNLFIEKKYRQLGVSTELAGYAAKELMFVPDAKIMVITPERDSGVLFLEKVKIFIEETPIELRPKFLLENSTMIKFDNGSNIQVRCFTPNAWLGHSISTLIIDEASYVKDLEKHIASVYPMLYYPNNKGKIIAISEEDVFFEYDAIKEKPRSIFEGFDKIFI